MANSRFDHSATLFQYLPLVVLDYWAIGSIVVGTGLGLGTRLVPSVADHRALLALGLAGLTMDDHAGIR